MQKRFWIECFKKFFLITIPTLVALITIFSCFSNEFEKSLKEYGIWGGILICLLCFSITLLYHANEMIHVIDFMGKEIVQDTDFDSKIIYNFYTAYRIEKKKHRKTNKIHNLNLYNNKQKRFSNKYLAMKDIYNDALQELSYIAMAHGFTDMATIFHVPIVSDIPNLLENGNITQLRDNIDAEYIYNVFINFYGELEGSILLCFYDNFQELINIEIKNMYSKDIQDYDKFVYSFLFELGSIFTGTCLTQFHDLCPKLGKLSWDAISHKVLNFHIRLNINISDLKVHNYTKNIYAIKLNGTANENHLCTSYMIFDRNNAEKLVNSFSKVAFRIL